MDESLTVDFDEPIPLFPLPTCVLLPHATIPLHIFEPRYRKMVGDALESERNLVAMALFAGDDWKEDYEGNPPLREHVCLGYIVRHQKFADGRYDILLQGLCRARIVEEVPHEPYRTALLEPTEADAPMEIDLTDQRRRLDALLGDPLLQQLAAVKTIQNWMATDLPTLALVDLATMALCDNSEQRYELLSQPDIGERGQWLERQLRDTRRTLAIADRFRPVEHPDGITMN